MMVVKVVKILVANNDNLELTQFEVRKKVRKIS